MSEVAFQMWEPMRQQWIAEHRFYVEQAKQRLLSQFGNIKDEADKAAEDYLAKMSVRFDPDRHSPDDFYEAAYDHGVELYQLLEDMRERTRMSVIAGMYHEWDKKLKDWIVHEMRHWHVGELAARAVWKADFSQVSDFLVAAGFNVKSLPCHERINAMRLVVNVFKHGVGPALDELKGNPAYRKEYIPNPLGGDADYPFPYHTLDHTCMVVTDRHLDQFSEAILDFWTAVPPNMFLSELIDVPAWFEKAFIKDVEGKK